MELRIFQSLVNMAKVTEGEDACFSDLRLINDDHFKFVYGLHQNVCGKVECQYDGDCIFRTVRREREARYV